jgi:hypothetical protein
MAEFSHAIKRIESPRHSDFEHLLTERTFDGASKYRYFCR